MNNKAPMNDDLPYAPQLREIVGEENILLNEPMKNHTSFQIGGPADYFVTPAHVPALKQVIAFCRRENLPFYILGNGSNLLVGDKGYRGVVIQIFNKMGMVTPLDNLMIIQSGALLSKVANIALRHDLTGFEFASGIPGTFGGAMMMNAGAYGGEMKDVIQKVSVLDEEGKVREIALDEMELGYRTSVFAKKNYIVLEGTIALNRGDSKMIAEKMADLKEQRTSKQPLEFPSAGSTFKRPEGYFAGKLISDSGLRGFQIGGAQVSEKHCGFVVNVGDATASDVISLMNHVVNVVREKFGVELEPEVRRLGEF